MTSFNSQAELRGQMFLHFRRRDDRHFRSQLVNFSTVDRPAFLLHRRQVKLDLILTLAVWIDRAQYPHFDKVDRNKFHPWRRRETPMSQETPSANNVVSFDTAVPLCRGQSVPSCTSSLKVQGFIAADPAQEHRFRGKTSRICRAIRDRT